MKHLAGILFVVFSIFFIQAQTRAQEANSYNLNVGDGLPSNHVYGMLTDRYGYLWICTDKGVARYNGYNYKLFSVSNGLPTEDVWELLEDRTGRIWLGAISDEIGYIRNNKYYKAHLNNISGTLYPTYTQRKGDGIVFHSTYTHRNKNHALCYSKDDSIYSVYIQDSFFDTDTSDKYFQNTYAYHINDELGNVFYINNKYIYAYPLEGDKSFVAVANKCKRVCELKSTDIFFYRFKANRIIDDFIISYDLKENIQDVYLTSIKTGEMKKVKLFSGNEHLQQLYYHKDDKKGGPFYIISNKSIATCKIENGRIVVSEGRKIDFFVNNETLKNSKINTFLKDVFWNYCVGTTNNGVWINYEIGNVFNRTNAELKNYRFVGDYKDSLSFWWNEVLSSFAILDKKCNVKYYHTGNVENIKGATYIGGDSLFISASLPCFFDLRKERFFGLDHTTFLHFGSNFRDRVIKAENEIYCVSGICFYKITGNNNSYTRHDFDFDRYNGIAYDRIRKKVWSHNYVKILVNDGEKSEQINKTELHSLGIKGLEHLCIDDVYGNVFFRGYDNIVMYDYENRSGLGLFDKVRFRGNVSMTTYENKLIVVSNYGVLFSLIKGKMEVSDPFWCFNPKSIYYSTIYGCHAFAGKLIVNTDKGLYSIDIPSDEQIESSRKSVLSDYRFLVSYADSIYDIRSKIAIKVGKNERKLLFDIINPYGVGSIKYYYSYSKGGAFRELNSNEINISEWFKPDNFYKVYIYAADDVWKSDIVTVDLYMVPYWWQTHTARKLILAGIILFCLLVLVASIYFTRRVVLNATRRRHLQMEMELKSIHAQINPHFIFNTLNSALLLVSKNKMDEAYSHISKFSRLLRSYLKSSRNKYISITEEAENLQNYIELQQTRFKDKFVYDIIIDEGLKNMSVKIPSLLIQPFVENAINHGILQKPQQGRLKIAFILNQSDNQIVCIIEDDGIGRKQSKINKPAIDGKIESYGDLMIKDLVSIFNRYEKMSIDISYTDKELPDTGTIVTITINNPHDE